MKSKDDIQRSLEQDHWSQDTVNAVIASKALKREAKGLPLHCYSLDIATSTEEEPFDSKAVNGFADLVYAKAQTLQEGETIRFQVAVKVNAVHWTAVDMEVSSNGVKMLNIDAAGDMSGQKGANAIFKALRGKYPAVTASEDHFKFFWLKHAESFKEVESVMQSVPQNIQYDENSCSRFTLDHLFHLSNIAEPFKLLQAQEHSFQKYSFDPFIKSFDAARMPKEFAFLYRGTQSMTALGALPPAMHQQVVNQRDLTLNEAVKERLQEVKTAQGETKLRNLAIAHKKQGFTEDVGGLTEREDYPTLIENRDAMTALTNGAFLSQPVFDREQVVRGHIEAAEDRMLKKSYGFFGLLSYASDKKLINEAKEAIDSHNEGAALGAIADMSCTSRLKKQQLQAIRQNLTEEPTPASEPPPRLHS